MVMLKPPKPIERRVWTAPDRYFFFSALRIAVALGMLAGFAYYLIWG
jgi:hypothetical protein